MLVTLMNLTYKETVLKTVKLISLTRELFQKLVFIIHPVKSVLKPVQSLTFLGFVLDSVSMTVTNSGENSPC